MQSFSLLALRLGLGYIFLWAGMGKVFRGMIPPFLPDLMNHLGGLIPLEPPTFILVMGILELVIGMLLILGLLTRISAAIAMMLLLCIVLAVGLWVDFGIVWKDIALATMSLSLVVSGAGTLSIDSALARYHDD